MAVQDSSKSDLKRKKQSKKQISRKKVRIRHSSTEELPWKAVSRHFTAGLDGDDGILDLEEVDNVEVVYRDTEAGKVVQFNVIEDSEEAKVDQLSIGDSHVEQEIIPSVAEPFDDALLPDWASYSLHPRLLRSLHLRKFLSPTPIQSQSIPLALGGRDLVGVAETGSGKTLAYGLPILHHLLSNACITTTKVKRHVRALILAPTRELALQVSSHLNTCLNDLQEESDEKVLSPPKAPPPVSVAAIVGGMSSQKQRRILDRGADVLVATPGRLWDIMEEDDDLAQQIRNLKFLVLDEADRMIEAGHFAELDNILRLTLRQVESDAIEPEVDGSEDESIANNSNTTDGLQTFVFSATLSKDLQKNLKRSRPKWSNKKNKSASTLDDLLLRLDFRDPNPEVIDLSPKGGVVSSVRESKIECLSSDKDVYLYYFLLRYPGRSIVFLSSIDGIRRLMPLMTLLQVTAFPLHSQLEQRQRLKNLDRFKSTPNAVLLATDVAARGLDVPAVDHVVHYQIPRSADTYIHRTGRTARAQRKGFALLMCAPDERRLVRSVLSSLGRQETEIPEMTVELSLVDKLKARIQLARQIDNAQHKIKKQNHERNWIKEAAEAMEIELDSDFASDFEKEERPSKHKIKTTNAKTATLKAELKRLLAQPLIARGVSTRYITSGSVAIVDDILAGEYHEVMLGVKKTEAGNDIPSKPKLTSKEAPVEYEEWHGFDIDL